MMVRDCMARFHGRRPAYGWLLLFLLAGIAYAQNAAPLINQVSPPSAGVGSPDVPILVTGANFDSGARVYWGGTPPAGIPLATTFLSSTQLSATIPSTYLTSPAFIALYVRNSDGTLSNTWAFTVGASGVQITTAALPQGTAGTAYQFSLAASGGTAPYTWSVSGSLPPGLSLAADGTLSGTPGAAGSFAVTVRVSDQSQLTASKDFTLTVTTPSLTITTVSPLFNGSVGQPYSQGFSAAGGTPPYRWSIASGQTGGLTLDAASGTLSGTPQSTGTFTFTVRVTDNARATSSKSFSLVVNLPALTITTSSPLPNAKAGAPYSQTFAVVGGAQPYSWSLGGSVPGLAIDAAIGVLSGTPASPGTFALPVTVKDKTGATATRTFDLTVDPAPLKFTTALQLPGATVGTAYSQNIAVSGGTLPFTWTSNGLPEGLRLDTATGAISGTPVKPGPYSFTVRVADGAQETVLDLFRIDIGMPPLPSVTISGPGTTMNPADQATVQVSISSPYTADISGQLLLTFTPDSGAGDNTVVFSTGGRSADFTIPAGKTGAVFTAPTVALQTGTVAGNIAVSAHLQALGADVTPNPEPSQTVRVERAAPSITTAKLVRNASGFNVEIIGFSTTLEVTEAKFHFTVSGGQTLQNADVTVPIGDLFSKWFQDAAAAQFGSQFKFTQPFTVQGNAGAVNAQSVTLTNSVGTTTLNITP